MDISSVSLSAFILFCIIYFAVRLAINPLLHRQEEIATETEEAGLICLRDMGVFNNNELEEVIGLYCNRSFKKGDYEKYQKYYKVLNELKNMGYFTNETYLSKINKLKKFCQVD